MTQQIPRILVVDDNPEIHGDFRKILQAGAASSQLDALEAAMFGTQSQPTGFVYAIDFASQGSEALAMVQQARAEGKPYHMAFVDVRMPPGWDGVKTISEIRKVDPEMEFAICTAYSDYTPEEAGRKIGLSNGLLFIVKPFDADIVRQVAKQMTQRMIPQTRRAG
jgi:CheY-like chemotaxis protein